MTSLRSMTSPRSMMPALRLGRDVLTVISFAQQSHHFVIGFAQQSHH
jgi:hypothetical protein